MSVGEPIAPVVNDLNRPFWTAAEEGRLVLPSRARGFFWPPCPRDFDPEITWREAPAEGVLSSLAIYRRPFQKAFADLTPYGIGEVTLDAGPRLKAHLANPDAAGAPRPGERVRVCFRALVPGGPKVPQIEREGA